MSEATVTQITIPIRGMSCGGCVRNVQRALGTISGVHVDSVSVGSAIVSFDPAVTDRRALNEAIERAGYEPL
jgi:copper chaperone CopZ